MWCDLYTLEFLMTPRHECRIKDLSRCSSTFTLDIPWAMIYVSNGAPTSLYVKSKFHPRGEARRCCWHGNPVYIAELLPKLVHDTTGVNYMTTSMKLTISAVLYRPPCSYMTGSCIYKKHRWTNMCVAPRAARFARYFILLYNQECFRRNCQYEHSQYKFKNDAAYLDAILQETKLN